MELKISFADEIQTQSGLPLLFEGILRMVAEMEELPSSCEVSLLVCGNSTIGDLNERYRNVANATDVLSFPQYEEREELLAETGETPLLGDIVISLEKAREQAGLYGHSLDRELGFLFIHGLMHLLGYDHNDPQEASKMRQKEEAVLELWGLRREDHAGPQL